MCKALQERCRRRNAAARSRRRVTGGARQLHVQERARASEQLSRCRPSNTRPWTPGLCATPTRGRACVVARARRAGRAANARRLTPCRRRRFPAQNGHRRRSATSNAVAHLRRTTFSRQRRVLSRRGRQTRRTWTAVLSALHAYLQTYMEPSDGVSCGVGGSGAPCSCASPRATVGVWCSAPASRLRLRPAGGMLSRQQARERYGTNKTEE
jgi:hypothetical protein